MTEEIQKIALFKGVMKNRLEKEEQVQLFTFCKQLKLESSDGKNTPWKEL